ncbi:MAG: outer membrane protein assembly factor BamA [Gemmobacter sp.]
MMPLSVVTKRGTRAPRIVPTLFAALLLLAFPLLAALPAAAQQYRFNSVVVEGNERIESRTVLSYARLPRGQAVSAAELNDAYQRILGSGLFETVDLVPRGGTLVIRVAEFPTIGVVNFEGNRRLRTEELSRLVGSQARRIYSPSQAEADAAAITEAYAQRGRLAARVEPRIIRRPGNRVDLVFEIAEGQVVEVERLSFVGNRAFSDRRLRQVLETRQAGLLRQFITADTYNAERIEVDKGLLRDFYLSRGYIDFQVLDATAEILRDRSGFFVTFTVREGLPYRFGRLTTVSEFDGADAAEFHALSRLREGQTFTPTAIENTIARMEQHAARKGLTFLRVDPRITRNDRDQTLDIEFALVRGPRIFVERIDIEGNATTLDQVIRRQFRIVEGDPFNPREIREAAERIRALGFFSNASVDTRPGSGPDQVLVKAEVTEQPTGSLSFGASYGRADGLGLAVGLSESNFLGRGQFVSLDLNLGASNATSSFSFSEPAFLGRDLRFTFEGFYSQSQANFSTWDTRSIQVRPSVDFPISENGRLELRYTLGKNRMFNVDPARSSPILVREEATGGQYYSALGYGYSWDNRRGGLRGGPATFVLRFGQDFAGLGGDLKYIQTTALAAAETRILNEEVTLRAELEAGAIHARGGSGTRVTERFFLDSSKIRGFEPFGIGPRDVGATAQDALGGNYFAVARFEAQFPVGLPVEYGVKGGVFWDVGTLWGLNDTAGIDLRGSDRAKLRSAVGVSLFWETPIGPLRFNFSRALRKESYDREQRFDVTISTRF